MERAMPRHPDTHDLLSAAVGPHPAHCAGAACLDEAHLLALVLGVGVAPRRYEALGACMLDRTVAFDLAEVDTANIGGINLTTVSSFLGPRGLLLGYDVGVSPQGVVTPLPASDGANEPRGDQLIDAAAALFGRHGEPRLPLYPGGLVPCAHRVFYAPGPVELFAAVGVGVPTDRRAEPCILMEDVGVFTAALGAASLRQAVELSVRAVAEVQDISLDRVFVALRRRQVPAGDMGCAMVACPYFLLPGGARASGCSS